MNPAANRVKQIPPYIFAKLDVRKKELAAQGVDIIPLDMGSPDLPPPDFIIDALAESAHRPGNHGYPGFAGIPALRKATADYYQMRFGVTLDPNKEVLMLIGSKEGIANSNLAFVDPGDLVLVSDPGYPTYTMGARLAGGETYSVPLLAENNFLPELAKIPVEVARKARILWLNYPNNPTGASASLEFFERAIAWARQHNVFLLHDAPYCDVCFDGYVAPSILQVPGAKDVCLEFNSLSKSHNMAGWRIGMAVGNANAVSALGQIKSNIDSGIFRPLQDAAITALTGDQSWLEGRNATYQERRDIVVDGLHEAGIACDRPQAGLYVWAETPLNYSSADFGTALLEKTGVSLTPGSAYGEHGEGYVRISLGTPTPRVREAMARIKAFKY